jgi:hypothetical protein
MAKKADSMFPCQQMHFTKEGRDNFDRIFNKENKSCQKEKDIQKVRGKEKGSNGCT